MVMLFVSPSLEVGVQIYGLQKIHINSHTHNMSQIFIVYVCSFVLRYTYFYACTHIVGSVPIVAISVGLLHNKYLVHINSKTW